MPSSRTALANPSTQPSAAAIVRRFLLWAQHAGGDERAEAASALARAYLHAGLTDAVRDECAVVMSALLDDPHVPVRRAMAEAFASARGAPRAVVIALANDRSEIAAPLLARSPLLTDAELVDCVAAGDAVTQCAVARRPGLGAGAAAALAEVGTREAALALIDSPGAVLTRGTLRRLRERFDSDREIRQALLAREDLPAFLKGEIAIATEGRFDRSAGGLARERAARDAALAAIAADCPNDELPELVRMLRARGVLTTALLLRSLLGGELAPFAAALAELSGLPSVRAAGLVRDPRGAGFAAAALRAGLPDHALPVFRAALLAIATRGAGQGDGLKGHLIRAVIAACEARDDPALSPFLALLWRFAAEAACADARTKVRDAIEERTLPSNLDFTPANDDAATGFAEPPVEAAPSAERACDVAPPVELSGDLITALDAA